MTIITNIYVKAICIQIRAQATEKKKPKSHVYIVICQNITLFNAG